MSISKTLPGERLPPSPPEVVVAAQARGQARDLWATARELLVELGPD